MSARSGLVHGSMPLRPRRSRNRVAPEVDLDADDGADVTARDELGGQPRRRVVTVVLADHQRAPRGLGRPHDPRRLVERRREGLLEQDVQPGSERLERDGHVRLDRGRHEGRLRVRGSHRRLEVREHLRGGAPSRIVAARADSDEST